MSKKSGKWSSSDLKKWGAFIGFLAILFLVLVIALKPGGEDDARALTAEAEARVREASTVVAQTQAPQDMANLDIAREALRKAKIFIVESDFSNATDEAKKAKLNAEKILDRRGSATGGELRARITIQDMVGNVQVKRRFNPAFQAVKPSDTMELADTIQVSAGGGARLIFSDRLEMVITGESELTFPDFQSASAQDGVRDISMESGFLHIKAPSTDNNTQVITRAGRVDIFPGGDVWVGYRPHVNTLDVRVTAGRVGISTDDGSRTLTRDQSIRLRPGSLPEQPIQLPSPPELFKPDNISKIDANQNGFAKVDLSWRETNAGRYRLEVSNDSMFANLIQEKPNLSRTNDSFDLRIGVYYWRVSTIDADSNMSVPSLVREFEVTGGNQEGANSMVDRTPPHLVIYRDSRTFVQGYVATIRGKTEPGAKVTVQDEIAFVSQQNNEFFCTLDFPGRGIYTVTVIAVDKAGNQQTEEIKIEVKD